MAKRANTTGGPKQRRRGEEDIERRDAYLSRAERDRIWQQRVRLGSVAIGAIVALIIAGALLWDSLVVPSQALTTVNGQEVSVRDYQKRLQYERFRIAERVRSFYDSLIESGSDAEEAQNFTLTTFSQNQNQQQQFGQPLIDYLLNEEFFAQQILTSIEQELVIEDFAEQYDLQVDDAEIQAQVDDLMSSYTGRSIETTPSPTPSEEPTITLTPLVSATPSSTPTETLEPSPTIQPTAVGCAEDDAECPTVTPLPTLVPSNTPTNTPEVTETPTPSNTPLAEVDARATVVAFRSDFFDGADDESGLNEDDVRQIFYYRALSEVTQDFVTSDPANFPDYYAETEDIWVNARHILISFPEGEVVAEGDENEYFEQAQAIVDALNAGEPFAALAIARSDDPGSGARGGDLGWASSANYVEGFKEAVETSPLGEISEPVRSQFGYHIIQVMDRELRELDEATLQQRQQEAFGRWLEDQTLDAEIVRREGWQDFIPSSPDYNDLLSDILPEFDPNTGLQTGG